MTWWCGMSAAQMLPVAINHAVDVSITLSGPFSPGRRCRAGAAGQPTGAGTIFWWHACAQSFCRKVHDDVDGRRHAVLWVGSVC